MDDPLRADLGGQRIDVGAEFPLGLLDFVADLVRGLLDAVADLVRILGHAELPACPLSASGISFTVSTVRSGVGWICRACRRPAE